MKRKTKQNLILNCIIVSLTAVLVFLAGVYYFRDVRNREQAFMEQHIHEMAEKNTQVFATELQNHQGVVQGLAGMFGRGIANGYPSAEVIKTFLPVCERYGYKRIGFCDVNGSTVTTDDYQTDFSSMSFFVHGIRGESYLSEVFTDTLGIAEDINVFSEPVYIDGKICGVLFVTYRNSLLQDRLNMEFMGKNGSVTILDDNNKLVAASSLVEHEDAKENTYANCLSRLSDERQREVLEALDSNENSMMKLDIDEGKYLFYMPLSTTSLGDWRVVSIASQKAFDEETMGLSSLFPRLFSVLLVILLLGALVFVFKARYFSRIEQKEWENLAYNDVVTKGRNYIYFKEILAQRIVPGVIVSMDIRSFKTINTVCGVDTGDLVLQRVSECMEEFLLEEELMGHINADRFVMFLRENDEETIRRRLDELSNSVAEISGEFDCPQIEPCFGVCSWSSYSNIEEIYSNANTAKRLIKGNRQASCGFFRASETKKLIEEKKMEDHFQYAINNREFEVWYQPKFDPNTNVIVGAEALVRWRTKEDHLISPGVFIPLFERNGNIRILDEYMFRSVCKQQKEWREAGMPIVPVSINLSRASLYSNDVINRYISIAQEYGVELKDVPIEITESAAMDESAVKTLVDLFNDAGFLLFMDDFGSGYSSLASLNDYHFNTIKIDKSLVDHIGDESGERLLFHSITLAKELGMNITAEGVENESQVKFLMKLQCDNIQGFYYSRPLPLDEFEHKYMYAM